MPIKNLYVVTGCSSGIGRSLCELLLQNPQNKVIGIARKNNIEAEKFQFYSIDLSQITAVKSFDFPLLDGIERVVLINNAGTLGEINTLDQIDIKGAEQAINVNYTAPMLLATKFIHQYQSHNIPKIIINISSGAATSSYASWANYCASKAALEMLTRCINIEQEDKEYPFTAYAIAPGVVDTNMQMTIRNTDISNFKNKDKFVNLYKENQLYNSDKVAEKLIEISLLPKPLGDKIFRIQL